MKCPKCGSSQNIVHFLRHQKMEENDEDTQVNCWTILCKDCGNNQSFLLDDLLDEVFEDWSELKELKDRLEKLEQISFLNSIPIETEIESSEEVAEECGNACDVDS